MALAHGLMEYFREVLMLKFEVSPALRRRLTEEDGIGIPGAIIAIASSVAGSSGNPPSSTY